MSSTMLVMDTPLMKSKYFYMIPTKDKNAKRCFIWSIYEYQSIEFSGYGIRITNSNVNN